jgi:hypothetical protein
MVGGNDKGGMGEAAAVLGVFAVVATAIVVTYARVPLDDLYNVSVGGVAGGLGRMVVFLNFSTALVAIPIAIIAAGRIDTRAGWIVATVAVALSAVIFVPGIVEQSDLDVRPVNALPRPASCWRSSSSCRRPGAPGSGSRHAAPGIRSASSLRSCC